WFLMQSRWMLYQEHGSTLDLLPGIPRVYLEAGKRIELKKVASYFGPVSFEAHAVQNRIEATVACDSDRKLAEVSIRLPHPLGRKAIRVEGGVYDAAAERVRV